LTGPSSGWSPEELLACRSSRRSPRATRERTQPGRGRQPSCDRTRARPGHCNWVRLRLLVARVVPRRAWLWRDAPALWAHLADGSAEEWLSRCKAPFWGRPGKNRPDLGAEREHFRHTDLEVPATGGIRPKSVFQIGGLERSERARCAGCPCSTVCARPGSTSGLSILRAGR
jgi:hypothetical protein